MFGPHPGHRLMDALLKGEAERAARLVAPGDWLDKPSHDGRHTPLVAAVETGALAVVRALLAAGASPSAPTPQGQTPLHVAAREGEAEIAKMLVEAGADVDARIGEAHPTFGGRPVLFDAFVGRNAAIIRLLLEHGADPRVTDRRGRSALFWAEHAGKRAVSLLAKALQAAGHGATLSAHDAARTRDIARLKALADAGAPLDAQEGPGGQAPLHVAAEACWPEGVAFLLALGVPADACDRQGLTPLMTIGRGKAAGEIARALIAAGADVNAETLHGWTPLTKAGTQPTLVRALLDAGADPNRVHTQLRFTDFLYLCTDANAEVLGALLDAGADVTVRDVQGQGAADYARVNRPPARALIAERMGLATSPADRLRLALADLAKRAEAPEFQAFVARLAAAFGRKPAPWKRRKGGLHFHDVPVARIAALVGLSPPEAGAGLDDDGPAMLLARLGEEARAAGASVFYTRPEIADGRLPLALLPITEPMAAPLCCGTNANLGGDTTEVVERLTAIAADDPFAVIGCGHDFLHGALRAPSSSDPQRLAARLRALCPELTGERPGSPHFFLWWD